MSVFSGQSKLVLTVSFAALLIAGAWFYMAQQRELRRATEANLNVIGELKVEQIAAWRAERVRDASGITGSRLLADELSVWLSAPSELSRRTILTELSTLVEHRGYDDAYLVSPDGSILLSYSGAAGSIDDQALPALNEALATGDPTLSDLHMGASRDTPHLGAIAPVLLAGDDRAIGAIVLISDASRTLFPIIQAWPTESRTAETLLVRRDGDDVLFMNDLRHQAGTALSLRLSATTTDLSAARVLNREWGFVEGRDYRGVRVAAVALPVPGTEWAMIAKIDAAEVFAVWRFRSTLILAGIAGLAVLLAVHTVLLQQRAERARFEKLYRAERQAREGEERYGVIMRSIADGVVSMDVQGRVDLLNPVAEMLTGWTTEQARGRPIDEVLHIVDRTTRAPIGGLADRVFRDGALTGIPRDALLISKTGKERRIAGACAPMLDPNDAVLGAVVVFQDTSESERAREAEREHEERWHAYVEQSPYGVFIANERGEYIEVNPAACRITGYSAEELTRLSIPDLIPREDREAAFEHFQTLLREGVSDGELPLLHKSGRRLWWNVSAVRLSETRFLGFVSDITTRVEAEEQARKSSGMLERVFDVLPIGLWFADKEGKLIRGNPAGVRIWGAEPLVPPSEYGVFKARRLPSGEEIGPEDWALLRTIRDGETIVDELLEIDALDGVKRVILNYTAPILDDTGAIEGAVIVNQDMTELMRAREAVRSGEERWQGYVESAPYGVIIINERGEHIEVNPAACRISGYSAEELLTKGLLDMTPPDDRFVVAESFQTLKETGEVLVEVSFLHKSGEVRWWTVSAVRLSDTRFIGFVSDSTERRRSEEERERLSKQLTQAQKMESVGRLAGGVAHDFNNMLQVILGNAEIALASPEAQGRIRDLLEEVQDAARSSAGLTRQLLAFARQQPAMPEVLDLNETIPGTLSMLRRLIGEDIDLRWVPGDVSWNVKIDPTQVDQILANLCVNARDALPGTGLTTISTGSITLDDDFCQEHPGSSQGDHVVLAVSDTGMGMDEETLSHIFDPFYSTKDRAERSGTGLGLATVYGIVKQNGGFIDVESEPGQGSTFRIYLPRFEETAETAAETASAELQYGEGETVLLVDDEASILSICRTLLERLGYAVLTADSPHKAMALAEFSNRHIDILLTDVVMPNMNGKDLSDRISTRFPDMKTLFMSGYTSDVIARHGVLEEGVSYIQKPFVLEDLARKIREVLEDSYRRDVRE